MIDLFKDVIEFFIANEGAWAVLFVLFLLYTTRQNSKREERLSMEIERHRRELRKDLKKIEENTMVILETWKILIKKELERRKEDNENDRYNTKRKRHSTANISANTTSENGNRGAP